MIIEKNKLRMGVFAIIVFLIIGAGYAIFANSRIQGKNIDEVNSQIEKIANLVSDDKDLMSKEQIEILESLKEEQKRNYDNRNIEGLLAVKLKLEEFKKDYPGIILNLEMIELSYMELPQGAIQKEKDKLTGLKNEISKAINYNSLSLDSRLELIRSGIKQGNEIILGVNNRIVEEKNELPLLTIRRKL